MAQHNEVEFERELCEHLEASGWLYSADDHLYDKQRALDAKRQAETLPGKKKV